MAKRLRLEDLKVSETAALFQGSDHGATASFFVTSHPAGAGVRQHRHPYEEIFIIRGGTGTFTVDGEEIDVESGDVLIVPPETSHGFTATGEGELRQVTIHPSAEMRQEWLEDEPSA